MLNKLKIESKSNFKICKRNSDSDNNGQSNKKGRHSSDNENNGQSNKKRKFCKNCKRKNAPDWVFHKHHTDNCANPNEMITKSKQKKTCE